MGRGNKTLAGNVVKEKVGDLEEELRGVFTSRMSNELTGVV